MKKSFLIAAIIASVTGATFAANDKTVASKSYVDTKQVMIPAASNSSDTLGSKVVTYTDTAGAVGARGIVSDMNNYDPSTDSDKLITAWAVGGMVDDIYDDLDTYVQNSTLENYVQNSTLENYVQNDSLVQVTVPDLTCANQACDLYEITAVTVYAKSCTVNSDCACYENGQAVGAQRCQNGKCTGECEVQ